MTDPAMVIERTPAADVAQLHTSGRAAAGLIWNDSLDALSISDPRRPEFAAGVLEGLAAAMRDAPGLMRKVVAHAAAAAEDLNVEPFQGIVEVLQNADDLGAKELRIAVRAEGNRRQLLLVHNGSPVTCQHVLAMTLPYLTTKTGDADQKGRFGIGLKTLKRISSRVAIHSAPYHFSAEGLQVVPISAAEAIDDFYDPTRDTLLILDLLESFDANDLARWFDSFNEENLLFLRSVTRFVWHELLTGDQRERFVNAEDWSAVDGTSFILDRRYVTGSRGGWIIFRATIPRAMGIDRSHKATGNTTTISFALADHDYASGLFIGFRTRVPVSLPFSIDAQFDPSTAREGLIDNSWNRWLISRCGDVLAAIAGHLLAGDPILAWPWIVTPEEHVGLREELWPHSAFVAAFNTLRADVGALAKLRLGEALVALPEIAYEGRTLEHFLTAADIILLQPHSRPLIHEARDDAGRWRKVMDSLAVSTVIDADKLVGGFLRSLFAERPTEWWVEAADRLTQHVAAERVIGTPCWLSDDRKAISAAAKGTTARPLVVTEQLSDFARRWRLFERLDGRYAESAAGKRALVWLHANASVTSLVDAASELAAFGEAYGEAPVTVTDVELRELRDRFDLLTDRLAEPLGPLVGKALLLDGFTYRGGKRTETVASTTTAYLSRTLDNDYPYWPDAAATLPDIVWLSASYDDRLKTGATRSSRKRQDGIISRGPRKFLILLGAACCPRVVEVGRRDGSGSARTQALQALTAEYVKRDYVSPDLERVLASLRRIPKKDRKLRSSALLKALSRYWDTYSSVMRTTAYHMATKYEYSRGEIEADWLCKLKENEWVAIGTGELSRPEHAVIRTSQTQTLYSSKSFVAGITSEDLRGPFTSAMKLITDVRASDLVTLIETLYAEGAAVDVDRLHQSYRALARFCPATVGWNSKIDDITASTLRARFSDKSGLVYVAPLQGDDGNWRRPNELLTGKDIFHDPGRFAPGGLSCGPLWAALGIRRADLDDCILGLRRLSANDYSIAAEAILIDVYRYMEPLVANADKRQRAAMRSLPVGAGDGWTSARPIFHVDDRELRDRLAASRPDLRFWTPPCDVHALPNTVRALGLRRIEPMLTIEEETEARERGNALAPRFQACVDHLANELARNDPTARDRIGLPWSTLRDIPLSVRTAPFNVRVRDPLLSIRPITVQMEAVLEREPARLIITENAFPQRNRGGRVIAQLFAPEARHRLEAEWVASWVASTDATVERMALASDEALEQALSKQAAAAKITPNARIKVTPPASRSSTAAQPRKLKTGHGGVAAVEVLKGSGPQPAAVQTPLVQSPPPSSSTLSTSRSASTGPVEYDRLDLEQRGWEILVDVLSHSDEPDLVDFRKRHHIGADGVIDWKTFIELKATGRGTQSSVELSSAEFERAQEKGLDFMLALVSGLEEGETTEIRLILDPVNRTGVRPSGSVRLVGLLEAPAVVLRLAEVGQNEATTST